MFAMAICTLQRCIQRLELQSPRSLSKCQHCKLPGSVILAVPSARAVVVVIGSELSVPSRAELKHLGTQ